MTVRCLSCYVKGAATAELTINDSRNISQIVQDTIDDVREPIERLYNDTVAEAKRFRDHEKDVDTDSFDVDIQPISLDPPDASVEFRIDGLDIYLDMNVVVAAGGNFTIPLLAVSPVPFSPLLEDLVDIAFKFELILGVIEGEFDIDSGVHLKVNDAVSLKLNLFGDETQDAVL